MNANISKGRLWTSRIMSLVVVLFMLFDGISKLAQPAVVKESTLELGFAEHHIVWMGIFGLLFTALFVIPRTSFLGAVLLTAFFGGAVVAQMRVDAPLLGNILFPVYMAVFMWGALWLRDDKLRKLFS